MGPRSDQARATTGADVVVWKRVDRWPTARFSGKWSLEGRERDSKHDFIVALEPTNREHEKK